MPIDISRNGLVVLSRLSSQQKKECIGRPDQIHSVARFEVPLGQSPTYAEHARRLVRDRWNCESSRPHGYSQ
jgi:hypothetical protein